MFGGVLWVAFTLFFSFPSLGLADFSATQSLVKNIRVGHSPEYVRVVFDLEQQADYAHQRLANPDRATITIQDVVLGPEAQQAIVSTDIPHPMSIYSWKGDRVRVDLDLAVMGTFRILSLDKPYRLVIDLYDVSTQRAHGASKSGTSPKVLTEEQRRAEGDIRTIVIDPGHGGKDPGATVKKAKLEEKDLVLDIALRLRLIMENRSDATIYMTRETDVFVELEDRVALANEKKADLFISIHANAHSNSKVEGLEVYTFGVAEDERALAVAARENGISLEEIGDINEIAQLNSDLLMRRKVENSIDLAWLTREAMAKQLGAKYNLADLGVKTAPFYVLRHTAAPMAGILAEVAYLTNSKDRKRLASSKFRQQVAESIFVGISEYIPAYNKSQYVVSGE
ncbi:MAG: hypothetical protein CMH81_07290 [Nitrospiraceae bacterium]|nr:hypothetical protein [Nitrospiraceae bacterium]